MKYIIVESLGDEYATIFDEILDHSSVAGTRKVISAGFVYLKDVDDRYGGVNEKTCCCRGSFTLGIKSRPEDTEIVERALRNRL